MLNKFGKTKTNIMTNKQKNQDMQQLMCLSFILCEKLDALKVTTPRMIKYKTDLQEFADELGKEVADTSAIQNTNYFWQIMKKFDTVMRKEFQDI